MENNSDVLHFYEMMLPTLQALKELGGSANIGELNSKAIDIMKLPDKMLNILQSKNSTITKVEYRLSWARTYLKKYGLIENSSRGIWSFTKSFDGNIDKISPDEVNRKVKALSIKSTNINSEDGNLENDGVESPAEFNSVHEKLRNILQKMTPDAFERLTLRLLRESGFIQVEVTGKSNDHGIDGKGIIRLNGIMSFHMIFQCKRYKYNVSPSEIRDFRGAMQGRADKGLFITTGYFSNEAKKEAMRDGAPALDLIDGDALIEKLCELGLVVDVTIEEKKHYKINKDWFSSI